MNKDNFNKTLHGSFESFREYIDLKSELYALIVLERISKMLSKFLTAIVFIFFLFFFLLFISLGFINWFHEVTGTTLWGYVITAVFYLVIGLIIFGMSKKLFLNPMLKGFTEVLFEEEDTLDSDRKSKQKDEKSK
jgi:hypothetical protein